MAGTNLGYLLNERARCLNITRADLVRSTGLNIKTVNACFENSDSTKFGTAQKIAVVLGVKIKYTVG